MVGNPDQLIFGIGEGEAEVDLLGEFTRLRLQVVGTWTLQQQLALDKRTKLPSINGKLAALLGRAFLDWDS